MGSWYNAMYIFTSVRRNRLSLRDLTFAKAEISVKASTLFSSVHSLILLNLIGMVPSGQDDNKGPHPPPNSSLLMLFVFVLFCFFIYLLVLTQLKCLVTMHGNYK